MALTVTSRGTGTHNTGATTLVPGGRSATLAVGSMGVLCIALDNAGGAGDVLIAPDSWTDAKGNVWTLRPAANALFDNGAASAGIEMAIYTAPITVALLTTDLGTMTWKTGASPVAKAWTWYEVIPSGANTVAYSTGGTIAGATAANATVVTASVPVGDAVIAGYFSENVAAVTGDADSTNGTWAAQQTATIGTTTSGVRIATQQKVQTTTPSTQSYDVTVTSQDRIAGYIMLHEVVNTTVTPGVLSLATTTFAPTVPVSNNQTAVPGVAALATSTFAPTVPVTANQTATPGTAALALSAFAPGVATPVVATPSTPALVLAPFAPAVTAPILTTPGNLALALAGLAPTAAVSDNRAVTPDPRTLALTAFAPAVGTPVVATPATAGLAATAFAPSVPVSDHKLVTPDAAALALTSSAPLVTAGSGLTIVPDPRALVLAPFAPAVTAGANVTAVPGSIGLAMTAFDPTVVASDQQVVTPGAASLVLTTFAPIVGHPPLPPSGPGPTGAIRADFPRGTAALGPGPRGAGVVVPTGVATRDAGPRLS